MRSPSLDVVQGTLDFLVLAALTRGPAHGYGVLEWLRQATDGQLAVEDAALYPALHRLAARGLVEAEWGLSDNNRRARFYRLTPAGRRALRAESEGWRRYVLVVGRVMQLAGMPA